MSESEPQPAALSVEHLEVGKVSVWNSPRTSALVTLTPLLSVLITAIALLSTTVIQVYQGSVSSKQKTETDWRNALEKVTLEDRQAIVASLEMQTFYEDRRYGEQARSITSIILPKVADPDAFDTALFAMKDGKRSIDDAHFLSMARSVTNELQDLYSAVTKDEHGTSKLEENAGELRPEADVSRLKLKASASERKLKADRSFEAFVETPEDFLDDRTMSRALHTAQSDAWKLDSLTAVLSARWNAEHLRQVPASTDLSGITFLNHDFRGIDFRNADMSGSSFAGKCHVSPDRLASTVTVHCKT